MVRGQFMGVLRRARREGEGTVGTEWWAAEDGEQLPAWPQEVPAAEQPRLRQQQQQVGSSGGNARAQTGSRPVAVAAVSSGAASSSGGAGRAGPGFGDQQAPPPVPSAASSSSPSSSSSPALAPSGSGSGTSPMRCFVMMDSDASQRVRAVLGLLRRQASGASQATNVVEVVDSMDDADIVIATKSKLRNNPKVGASMCIRGIRRPCSSVQGWVLDMRDAPSLCCWPQGT